MIKSNNALTTANSGNVIEAKRLEVQHRKEKARSKANFTCTRNSLLLLLKELNNPNCHEVRAICKKMNGSMEEVMEVLSNFTEFYLKNGQLQCYVIMPVRKEEGKSYWKIPFCDDDATREK